MEDHRGFQGLKCRRRLRGRPPAPLSCPTGATAPALASTACPFSTGEGRGLSSKYEGRDEACPVSTGGKGGGGVSDGCNRARARVHAREPARVEPASAPRALTRKPPRHAVHGRADHRRVRPGRAPPPPFPSVLTGQASSLPSYLLDKPRPSSVLTGHAVAADRSCSSRWLRGQPRARASTWMARCGPTSSAPAAAGSHRPRRRDRSRGPQVNHAFPFAGCSKIPPWYWSKSGLLPTVPRYCSRESTIREWFSYRLFATCLHQTPGGAVAGMRHTIRVVGAWCTADLHPYGGPTRGSAPRGNGGRVSGTCGDDNRGASRARSLLGRAGLRPQ